MIAPAEAGEMFEQTPTGHMLRVSADGLSWQIQQRDNILAAGETGTDDPAIEAAEQALASVEDPDVRTLAARAQVTLAAARAAYQALVG